MRYLIALIAFTGLAYAAGSSTLLPATVTKSKVEVFQTPDLASRRLVKLKRNQSVQIAAQQGLWYKLDMGQANTGFVRVNDVRLSYAGIEPKGSSVLFSGRAGVGRASETAGVRGLDETKLRTAAPNKAQLTKLESYRSSPEGANNYARGKSLGDTVVAFPAEAKPSADKGRATQAEKRAGLNQLSSHASALGVRTNSKVTSATQMADASMGKSEAEQAQEERELGPLLASRVLGAAPLWKDAAAQKRVNTIGRWVASHSNRPELPWTFGIIDSTDVNAFAMPGGYVLMTRGLYQLLDSDAEVAAVLGHEISHIVQRDHYNVIHKQEMAAAGQKIVGAQVKTKGGAVGAYARDLIEKNGAAIMLSSLDRGAEYRSDEAAQIYLARSGYNPLALYSVLQKMISLGNQSSSMAQLFKTHPALNDRIDQLDNRGFKTLAAYTERP